MKIAAAKHIASLRTDFRKKPEFKNRAKMLEGPPFDKYVLDNYAEVSWQGGVKGQTIVDEILAHKKELAEFFGITEKELEERARYVVRYFTNEGLQPELNKREAPVRNPRDSYASTIRERGWRERRVEADPGLKPSETEQPEFTEEQIAEATKLARSLIAQGTNTYANEYIRRRTGNVLTIERVAELRKEWERNRRDPSMFNPEKDQSA